MTIIGGVGTLVGPILGAGLIEFAHHWLTEFAKTHPIFERWIIFFGILYILVVMFFPAGIVGPFKDGEKRNCIKEKEPEREKQRHDQGKKGGKCGEYRDTKYRGLFPSTEYDK